MFQPRPTPSRHAPASGHPAESPTLGQRVERVAKVIRRIIGVPDYDRYVEHVRAHHPGCTPMTLEEFTQQRLVDRYSRPGSRCC